MATKSPAYTWENGFRELDLSSASETPWSWPKSPVDDNGDPAPDRTGAYVTPPSVDLTTSLTHNQLGINVVRHWPSLYDGTNSPHGVPSWWAPKEEVDVLICGAGPSGLQVAVSLARQGVSFRIIDKADTPLVAGRADGVQPRFLETMSQWGLSTEVHEEGPLIERTAIYKDGRKLLFNRSHQSDSRYRGLHIITQGQLERIYLRDLARHKVIVERSCTAVDYRVEEHAADGSLHTHPVRATLKNAHTGRETSVRAKFLVGSDGAASPIRKSLGIPFDGVSTDIYWGIMDCVFESDYPHAWVFGSVISSKHGGCVIIPREDGYIRLYTQLDISLAGPIAASRQARDPNFIESGGRVEVHSITPEEVLEQANRIFNPYKLKFAAPLSWFAVWKISERVARSFSSPDMRVHLVGDAAHVHSVMGAFGLNASILDSANLAWKLGLAAKGQAKHHVLLPTYSTERRGHAVRIIEVSGSYLRFVCGSTVPLPNLRDVDGLDADHRNNADANAKSEQASKSSGNGFPSKLELASGAMPDTQAVVAQGAEDDDHHGLGTSQAEDLEFLGQFFKAHAQFLLGVDCPYAESAAVSSSGLDLTPKDGHPPAIRARSGVRAPNPRVCLSPTESGYLYDKLAGPPRFHLVLFASSLAGTEVRRRVDAFLRCLNDPKGFYTRFGGSSCFNVVVILKMLPFQWSGADVDPGLAAVRDALPEGATVVFDDKAPDEDAHTVWGANHLTGGVAVIRPDLWVASTAFPDKMEGVSGLFEDFLI
ncbi:Aromatic hydroxylase fmpF like protein [Verticillium longisporum]|nr:Aromatic hydroxylase fmpF like protein [Verticillium longisporum]